MQQHQLELNELKTNQDFQELVDAINAILCMDTDVEAAVVTSAHQKLDQATRQVNDRLKKCDSLLQQGLRAEALQEAQIEPKLLDVIAILDFDEREIWNGYAQQCGFPRVPELLVDVADDLQTAWADEEPLTDLRYRHRLHALARSPLPIRIDILRQLAKVDAANPLWEDELQIYEKARLADLVEECKNAAEGEDLEAIVSLESELKSSDWRVAPPKKLIGFAEAKSQEIKGKRARAHLLELEPKLNDAYSLSDVETARRLREEWGRHASVARLSEQDPLLGKVQEPFNWLAEKDRQDREQAAFEAAVLDLEKALDRPDAVKADFEPLYYKIEQFGRGVPENLQQRLALRVAELDAADNRRRRTKIVAIAAAAVAVLALIGVSAFLYARHVELSRHLANLKGLIEDEQLDKAEQYVKEREESDPRIYGHEDFQALVRQLEQSVQADADRRASFARQLDVARKTRDALTSQDPASLERSQVNKGYAALTEADRLAKTDTEDSQVLALKDELDNKFNQVQDAVDESYTQEVKAFHESVKALDPNARDYADELRRFRGSAEQLKGRKHIRLGLADRLVDPILAELDTREKEYQLAEAEAEHLAEIRAAIGDVDEYQKKLNDYVSDAEFSGTARQRDFQQVIKNETALWAGFEEWRTVKADLKGTNLVTYNPKYAPALLAKVNGALKHKGFPDEEDLKEVADFLNLLVQREQGGILMGLEKNVLNQAIVRGLYLLQTKDGKKYYSTKKPAPLGTTHFTIRYALDATLAEEKPLTVKREDVNNPLLKGGQDFDFDSPQMKFSRLAKEKIDKLSGDKTTWESDFLDILSALHADKEMDVFLKFLLISSIESQACQGSLYLAGQFQKNLDVLGKAGADVPSDANWINPEAGEGGKLRQDAADVLRKLTAPDAARKGLDGYLAKLKKLDLGKEYDWVAWLHKDRGNQWAISHQGDPPNSPAPAKLFVITRSGTSGPVSFTEIGELKLGQITVTAPAGSPALVQGRPVFVLR